MKAGPSPSMVSEPALQFEAVSKSYGAGEPAVIGIDLSVAPGEFVVFLGPSGCGKTTLLSLSAGLIKPTEGRVLLAGTPPVPGQKTAMVFQSFRLLPWKTARDNITFALPHLTPARRRARAEEVLDFVGLSRVAEIYPGALSGGMKQRLALARALAPEPDILLMDEPFASLDAQARELMQTELLHLTTRRSATVLFVTHSVDEALLLGDRIFLMSPRPGRIVETINLPFSPDRLSEDPRNHPEFIRLRAHLWDSLRNMVLNDPGSDFYGRRAGERAS